MCTVEGNTWFICFHNVVTMSSWWQIAYVSASFCIYICACAKIYVFVCVYV
jgi:hypothetical protein